MMAGIYDGNSFGPIAEREIPDDIPADDRAKIMTLLADDKKTIKQRYERVKQRIKDLRQESQGSY